VTPSQGLMQTIPMTYRAFDPLANMMAAVDYARSEYMGRWLEQDPAAFAPPEPVPYPPVDIRPRRGGKATAMIMKKMDEIRADGGTVHYADGGVIPPTGRHGIPTWLSPGEYVLTPEQARIAAGVVLERMGAGPTPEAIRDIQNWEAEPFDEYPDPPPPPCW
jgi:hypothetical protein